MEMHSRAFRVRPFHNHLDAGQKAGVLRTTLDGAVTAASGTLDLLSCSGGALDVRSFGTTSFGMTSTAAG